MLQANKEVDFDMILMYSYDLLQQCPFIAENVSSIIRSIHVDEYQDTNILQYKILAEVAKYNEKINYFFVGDVNQAIYGSLGGVALTKEKIEDLFKREFKCDTLTGCYRSTQKIIDFYNHFSVQKIETYAASTISNDFSDINYICSIDESQIGKYIADLIRKELKKGTLENQICVLAPQWWQLYELSDCLRQLLPDVRFDAPDIVPFKYNPDNIFFIIARLIFTDAGVNVSRRLRDAAHIISILREDFSIHVPDDFDDFSLLEVINSTNIEIDDGITLYRKVLENLYHSMQIDIHDSDLLYKSHTQYLEHTMNRIHKHNLSYDIASLRACFKEKSGVVVNTIHGIKGEEYETVICISLLEGYIPNWDTIIRHPDRRYEEVFKLLYVMASRAKHNLYMISESGRTTRNGHVLQPTSELISAWHYHS